MNLMKAVMRKKAFVETELLSWNQLSFGTLVGLQVSANLRWQYELAVIDEPVPTEIFKTFPRFAISHAVDYDEDDYVRRKLNQIQCWIYQDWNKRLRCFQ